MNMFHLFLISINNVCRNTNKYKKYVAITRGLVKYFLLHPLGRLSGKYALGVLKSTKYLYLLCGGFNPHTHCFKI